MNKDIEDKKLSGAQYSLSKRFKFISYQYLNTSASGSELYIYSKSLIYIEKKKDCGLEKAVRLENGFGNWHGKKKKFRAGTISELYYLLRTHIYKLDN